MRYNVVLCALVCFASTTGVLALEPMRAHVPSPRGPMTPSPRISHIRGGLGAASISDSTPASLRGSVPTISALALQSGNCIFNFLFKTVQLASVFTANVAGLFFTSCWIVSPDSTIFGVFELRTRDDSERMPGQLSSLARNKINFVLFTSLVVPSAAALYHFLLNPRSAWKLTHATNRFEDSHVDETRATRRREQTPPAEVTAVGTLWLPRLMLSLVRWVSTLLGWLGFLELNLWIVKHPLEMVISRAFNNFLHEPPPTALMLNLGLAAGTLASVGLFVLLPNLLLLRAVQSSLQRMGLAWALWSALSLVGLAQVVGAAMMVAAAFSSSSS